MVTSQPATSPHQLDLLSYTAPAASAPPCQPSVPLARVGRTLRAGTWMPAALVRGALKQTDSTHLQLVLDWMMEEDSGDTLIYDFGARQLRRLFADVPATSQIRISDNPGAARAIVVEIRAATGQDPHARMLIRDGAWYRKPATRR
jgi:hypothetical protein